MPVTCKPAPHGARAWNPYMQSSPNAEGLLKGVSHREHSQMKSILASSFTDLDGDSTIFASGNGFVKGAIQAYNQHHHLVIRPEDVWFSILTQFSLYVNANAELLRDKFVTHEGQKELEVWMVGTLKTVDYARFFWLMGQQIHKNVVDPELRDWILPKFSTTTKSDEVVASAIFMGSMQAYFTYGMRLCCGLPSVTLLGERSDWETILIRLDKLLTFGKEPTTWHSLLKPVITRFISTFESPELEKTKEFWQTIAHYSGGGSGPTYLSGWITAFCFWNSYGKPLHQPGTNPPSLPTLRQMLRSSPIFSMDGTSYHRIETTDIPVAYVSVPMTIEEQDGTKHDARITAGLVGMALSSSGEPVEPQNTGMYMTQQQQQTTNDDGTGLDTVQPESGWFVYLVKSKEELAQEQHNDILG